MKKKSYTGLIIGLGVVALGAGIFFATKNKSISTSSNMTVDQKRSYLISNFGYEGGGSAAQKFERMTNQEIADVYDFLALKAASQQVPSALMSKISVVSSKYDIFG